MAVLITRPEQSGKELANMLNKAGIANIHLPFFSICAGSELNELPNKLNQLNAGDFVFCVSKNAVKFCCATLKETGFHWRDDLNYLAVGQATAQYFASQGEIAVHYPIEQENSEALLNLAKLQDLSAKNILILRGNCGREFFADQAKLRGANVMWIESYQRLPISYNNIEQIDLWKRGNITQILVTSAEILSCLVDFVPIEEQNWLKSCQLITISNRIAQLAQVAGWDEKNIIIASKADNASLVNTLLIHSLKREFRYD